MPHALADESPIVERYLNDFHHLTPVCFVRLVLPRRINESFVDVFDLHNRQESKAVQVEPYHCRGDLIIVRDRVNYREEGHLH